MSMSAYHGPGIVKYSGIGNAIGWPSTTGYTVTASTDVLPRVCGATRALLQADGSVLLEGEGYSMLVHPTLFKDLMTLLEMATLCAMTRETDATK